MTVVFICGSLEHGKDGVGDYTRILSERLINEGHTISAIALNDPFIVNTQFDVQVSSNSKLDVLRISSKLPTDQKLKLAQQFVAKKQPQWISFQYVLYGLQQKGLPFHWMRCLRQIAPQCQWHIMMHELWIGNKSEDSTKSKIIGIVQQYIIRQTFHKIHPAVITTNLQFYQNLLQKIGYKSAVLPVFSNLPYGNISDESLYQLLPLAVRQKREEYYIGVFFGAVHPSYSHDRSVSMLVQKTMLDNKNLLLVHIGRSGSITAYLNDLSRNHKFDYIVLGEQNAAQIAAFFQQVDFGVSTYNKSFVGKSGSVAAMLFNRLPVILLSNAKRDKDIKGREAEFIENIPSIKNFAEQSTEWSEYYGVQHAANFYTQLLTKE